LIIELAERRLGVGDKPSSAVQLAVVDGREASAILDNVKTEREIAE
jgi:hypothetical protein